MGVERVGVFAVISWAVYVHAEGPRARSAKEIGHDRALGSPLVVRNIKQGPTWPTAQPAVCRKFKCHRETCPALPADSKDTHCSAGEFGHLVDPKTQNPQAFGGMGWVPKRSSRLALSALGKQVRTSRV